MNAVAAIFLFASLSQWLTERFFGSWLHGQPMLFVSAAISVTLTVFFGVNAFVLLGLPPAAIGSPWAEYVVTGLAIGFWSNAVHDFVGNKLAREEGQAADMLEAMAATARVKSL